VIDKHGDGSVVVGQKQQLQVHHLFLDSCLWISGAAPSQGAQLAVQIRHRGQAVACEVKAASDDGRKIHLEITGSLQAAARGQSGVLLQGDQVLGGGIISQARGPGELANGNDGVARG
jgi:tRNA U34 2-thiouridine synthase MnmA/TrmU